MQRVLDLDLDFFVHEVAYYRDCNDDRLDSEEYPPWTVAKALAFLRDRCGLKCKVPGFVVEHHKELFPLWRKAIEAGKLAAPFHLTHVDAHADLGQGDTNHRYLLTELLFAAPKHRN